MIDLHTHSTASDGTDNPQALVHAAHEAGLSAIALTDHDTLGGLPEASTAAADLGLRLVPGCEISCEVDRGTCHLVVLFLDGDAGPLQDRLSDLQRGRDDRNVRIVEVLRAEGLDITLDEVLVRAGGGSVGRPHVAAVLKEKGLVASIDEAFDRWLARGRSAYVERARLAPAEAIQLAHASGAVTVLAHPLSLDRTGDDLDAVVAEFASLGLDAMEVEYGRYSSGSGP
ncbi:MAG: PHP domain-containing protein [Actinobacteria bacterium]|nr:PHP domain-containing protein [Actinomycetota bacterium]